MVKNDEQPAKPPAAVLQDTIVETLGREIIGGRDDAPGRFTLESLQERFGVSRTVVRDAVQVLEALGLLVSKRRLGLLVQPPAEWNVFDPNVIRWRLESQGRDAQFRELTELRIAIEPVAASRAATRAGAEVGEELVRLADELGRLGRAGEIEAFLEADKAFHARILHASGNSMFSSLDAVVGEVLAGRTHGNLMPYVPSDVSLRLHEEVAAAIAAGSAGAAEERMRTLVDEVRRSLEARLARR